MPLAEETDAVEDNIVWDQTPSPGTVITKDQRVILKWNPPPQLIEVPEVKGKNFDDASLALSTAGFTVSRTEDVEDELAAGTVVLQDPPPGTKLAAGSVITLTVSKGVGTELVPNMQGRPVADARAELEGKGFVVTIVEEFNDTVPLGQVISTDPAADTALPKKSAVKLIVSKGPTLVEMPAVKGVTRAQAQQSIEAAGLRVSFEEVTVANASDVDKVLAQNPSPGTKVPKGTTVNLTVGKAAPVITTTSSTTTTTEPPPTTAAPTTSSTTPATTSTTPAVTTTTGP
jgi:eukaryotic-like serine/threonine-protein kinase